MAKRKDGLEAIPLEALFLCESLPRNYRRLRHGRPAENRIRQIIEDELLRAARANVANRGRLRGQASAGGRVTAGARTAAVRSEHERIVGAANRMISSGKDRRDVASILSTQFGKSTRQIRSILKRAGV
jgi:hypothetical protein